MRRADREWLQSTTRANENLAGGCRGVMRIYRVQFHYYCAGNHHENRITKYYRAQDPNDAVKRFPALLPCVYCAPGTISEGALQVECNIAEVSEFEFRDARAAIEPDVV
jgi:hypothetical protein